MSNNEASAQKRQKLEESREDEMAYSKTQQVNDEYTERDTTPDTDCFTDVVNVNKLRNLTQNTNEPKKILKKLLKPRFGFLKRLKRGSQKTELTELLIEVISVACKSEESDMLTTFLDHINQSKFFRDNVVMYLNRYLSGKEPINVEVFGRITEILKCLVTVFPSSSLDIVTQLSAPIHYLQNSTSVEISFEELVQELHWAAKHRLLGVPTRDTEVEEDFLLGNENNFRCISLAPTCEDIKGKGDPNLRKNKVFTRYTNVNDYLDVQFRLLREDLIRPLREGLAELLESREEGTAKKRKSVMKVYQKVQIVSWRCSPHGIVYKIHFDTSRLKRVKWGAGKRLTFGSIVCLSADQFQTMLIGTIAERNVKDLCNGVVFVSFESENLQANIVQFNCHYEMIESPAYYEPYKNVLGVLQYLDEKSLPFQKYLLNYRHKDVPPPKYLLNRNCMFDFSSAIKRVTKNCIDHSDEVTTRNIQDLILNPSSWPSADQLGLDESQYGALKTALTKEFAVIQGPPGTGKTFIGVLIVQLLLANKYNPYVYFENQLPDFPPSRKLLWEGPILIVCYTNHALDQFLEEIIRLDPNRAHGNKIVRLGSRCSSENGILKRCQLSEIMRHSCYRKDIGWTKHRLSEIEHRLTYSAAFVELAREELLHEDVLKDFMSHGQYEMLARGKGWEPTVLLQWLYDRSGDAWQSGVLHQEEDTHIQEDADCYEDQWDEQVGRQSDVGNARPKADFQDCKEKMRKVVFFSVAQNDTYFKPWQSLRKIHRRFQEEKPLYKPNVWDLSPFDRWRLYNFWVSRCVERKIAEQQTSLQDYSREKTRLDNILKHEHGSILSGAEIIAMTTTTAAKNNELLKTVEPKILIVEEAAEVLEAHIVASLSEHCQHLILIGDHQQLRPKPADDRLARHYWLHISLFERMVLNKMNCECLTIQHRMRPEISKLLVPHIYRSLQDHSNVHKYDDVAGVIGNLFFLNHSFEESSVDDMKSHSNEHEASFLSAFCKYLLNVGYASDKITVLTTYTGQLFLLRKYFPKTDFEGVRITPVDNFQGEENDIILLSLVRSNTKNSIGFLSISNRVCVALSRARKGLYIIGNGDLLRDTSPLWRDILDTLKSEGRLVEKIPLGCRKHTENVAYVSCAADFCEVPVYGCKYSCEFRLDCGHTCGRKCHELEPGHNGYKCMKPCQRRPTRCRTDHSCLKECHLECGNCPTPVQRTLARCQHTVTMECHEDENYFKCMEPCKKLCPVGHTCKNPCYYEYCVCTEPVKRILVKCQHEVCIPCNENERLNARAKQFRMSSDISDEESISRAEEFYYCHQPCKRSCKSGHPCIKRCYEACGASCTVMTTKVLPNCTHTAIMPCNWWVDYYKCQSECEKMCQAGQHRCAKQCYQQCGVCTAQVEKTMPKCNHTVTLKCHESPECVMCPKPCEKFLSCGHQCREMCGAAKCSQFCTVLVGRTLPCGHELGIPCSEDSTNYLCCEQVEIKTCEDGHTKMIDCYRRQERPVECTAPLALTCSTKLPNHNFTIPCHKMKNISTPIIGCQNTCNVELDCGHSCQQKCEDCVCSGKHSVCRETCNKRFPLCSHKCQLKCGSPCDRCLHPSTAKSRCPHFHFDTMHLCYEKCELCNKRCEWSCPHHICDLACWMPCDRPPCNLACGKSLYCGHKCVCLCGDPCSSKCRQCDRAEFAKIEKQLGIRLTSKSRYVVLQPCSHLVEINYMDDWAEMFEKLPPCYVDSSLIFKCPICKEKVTYCPRYNKVIKGADRLLNEAKQRLAESKSLKEKATGYVELWLQNRRSNEDGLDISRDLLGNGKGARLKLGSVCILYEIELLLEIFAKSLTEKYRPTLDKIGKQMAAVAPSYSKSSTVAGIVTLYRIYIEIQTLRLEKLTRGHHLRTIRRCKRRIQSLPALDTAVADSEGIWKTIAEVNKSLSTEINRHERMDDIEDYILYLNKFYDTELRASYMSQWMCCSKGHVFPNEEYLEEDMIDCRCPLCCPVHDYLLKDLRSSSPDNKYIAEYTEDEISRELPVEDRKTRVNDLKENEANKRKTPPHRVQGTDTLNVATTRGTVQKYPTTSPQSDQRKRNTKRRKNLGSDSSTKPGINEIVPDASCQSLNEKIVPFVREETVTTSRRDKQNDQNASKRSSREPIRGLPDNGQNRQSFTDVWDTGSKVSKRINIGSNGERSDRISDTRPPSMDQFQSVRDRSRFSETSAVKRSHRHAEHSASGRYYDWSPDYKRRRKEDSTAFDHSQFQPQKADCMEHGHIRHSPDTGTYERSRRPSRHVLSRRDYDVDHRQLRTTPVRSGARQSEGHRANNLTSSYNGSSSRQVRSPMGMEPFETYSGDERSWRPDDHSDSRRIYFPGNDNPSQREESAAFEHSQYADWRKQGQSHHPRYSGTYERGSHERKVFTSGYSETDCRRNRTQPVKNVVRHSESRQRHSTSDYVPPNYNRTCYRQVEPSATYSGEETSYQSNTRNGRHSGNGHDRRSQLDEERSERNMHTWNGDLTRTDRDTFRPTQNIKPPDLRYVINSLKADHDMSNEPTSTLKERFPDFDETFLTPAQVHDRPLVSYDEEFFDSLLGD